MVQTVNSLKSILLKFCTRILRQFYIFLGIADNPSPFQQMTFETAVGFLRSATLGGKSDNLDSPSSCIVMGKPFCGGTGTFQVRQNLLCNVNEQKF